MCVCVERLRCVLRDRGLEGDTGVCVARDGGMGGDVCGGRATVWVAVSRDQRCVCVCVWRYGVGERDKCVAVEKGQVCVCMCVKLGLVCVERLG